ncbi:extracellular solute-binding protein [Butyrivibrio sp. MB2005]|uniref:extracellular solute-binding protein n=1 Tax=Butyrivibrio sp. MB2005 TaxID=1280678 RepID=UPI00047D54F8|nr:extracellular solute-binding protein [Butyrivibrio sp. MB2005]
MRKKFLQLVSVIMAVCILTGCGLPFGDRGKTEGENKYPEFLTIDVFDTQANTQGLQRGWFAHIVREKFNMQLNIISQNQDHNGEATYETMRASGKLGDLIMTNVDDGRLSEMVREGLVLDMTSYLEDCENLKKYRKQMEASSAYAGVDGLWAISSEISENAATEPSDYDETTNAPFIRFDLYKQLGYPRISTLENILPVLREMQNLAGKSDSGKDVYAFSLFRDWDGGAMQNAGALTALYGYDVQDFVLLNPETGEIQSIADKDSIYFRMVKLLFDANQMGLVDPDSPYQNYETVASKVKDGAVLYTFWPWMGTSLYNSDDHLAQGKGFESIVVEDASYLTWGNDPDGRQSFSLMIGANTKDPQRLVDFVDWLYSPEGIECCGSPTGNFRGPENLTWEMTEDGPKLTDFGVDAFINMKPDLQVPEEFGGGTWTEGVSWLNFKPLDKQEVDERGNPYYYGIWQDYRDRTATIISDDWKEHYRTQLTPIGYYEEKDMITVVPGTEWAQEEYLDYLKTVQEQCRQTIIDYSWRMVFAESEDEFYRLKDELLGTIKRLDYDSFLEVNIENAKKRYEVLKQAAKESP